MYLLGDFIFHPLDVLWMNQGLEGAAYMFIELHVIPAAEYLDQDLIGKKDVFSILRFIDQTSAGVSLLESTYPMVFFRISICMGFVICPFIPIRKAFFRHGSNGDVGFPLIRKPADDPRCFVTIHIGHLDIH